LYSGKNILVVGLARSGLSSCQILYANGGSVTAYDEKTITDLGPEVSRLPDTIKLITGTGPSQIDIDAFDEIILSPGVPPSSQIIVRAAASGVPVVSEMELGLRHIPDVKIVAVTGTNGKTTTCRLIRHLTGGVLAGNIGVPLTSVAGDLKDGDTLILEVSSYQAVYTPSLAADIAVLLNIFPEHLSWHGSFDNYRLAKRIIFQQQVSSSVAVLNGSMEDINGFLYGLQSDKMFFSYTDRIRPGVCFIDGDLVYIDSSGKERKIFSGIDIPIEGQHNMENIMAAVCVWLSLPGNKSDIPSLKGFEMPPHRMQKISERGGVTFIDDSKATNMHSTLMALKSVDDGVILLMGGRSKGQKHPAIKDMVRSKVVELILFGESALELSDYLSGITETRVCTGMKEALGAALESAEAGMTVLLSPGGSSFDEFRDYCERGEKFAAWLEEMSEE
jgi:UDP-N-acetylmuramoylalanine--D-glutamate ligase